ncbi:hypothetical protein SMD11_1250 [Streptomyces albireticuli]|uniref:Uncharacterized protein n=1 Tax=Streptomyces albireticuli TaxID=1940 RepID=A0A1Z2KY92_9ACTN|nr:hypothetical protein [Streptomyces albireticuli]ARZ66911.1 hypothetical protein SMD11_1250 [Streptomyces albireticuli]
MTETGNAQRIRFAPNGALYIAPAPKVGDSLGAGTVLPTGLDKLGPPYKNVGFIDEGGVTITPEISTDPVKVWQSSVPVLYNTKESSFKIKATLMETSRLTTELFFGAKWVESKETPGLFRLDLKSTPELTEIALVVDWSQSKTQYRCVIGRAMISDRGAIQLQRAENGKFELTIEALDYNGSLGYLLTNDDLHEAGNTVVEPAAARLSGNTVEQGGSVVLTGEHFAAGKPAAITVTGPSEGKVTATQVSTDDQGNLTSTVSVAADTTEGVYLIKAAVAGVEVQAGSLTVKAKSTPK